jgi:ferric-dicitrate binding protein FerR (iron transport regulator)
MTDEEDVTARLLRLAGAPPDPAAERTRRVQQVVHREWRANRRRRLIRRATAPAIALLAVAASLLVVVWRNPSRSVVPQSNEVIAVGQRIEGRPVLRRGHEGRADPQPLSISTPIHADDVIETDDASRAALRTADGSSVRIDHASRIHFVTPAAIELIAGAAYIATSDGSRGFEVRTSMGIVRDVGTQFEVRLTESSLRLRVRTGTVEIRRGANVTAAAAGTEATVSTKGTAVRHVPPYGSDWAWTTGLASSFAIEGLSLRAFLEHMAGEEGWTLRYADPTVAEAAGRIILHGSVDGLRAEDALGVALATSGLQYRLRAGELLVSSPAAAR